MRIAFAGTPDFAAIQLAGLYEVGFVPIAVYTQPDRPQGRGQHCVPSPVKQLALQHSTPVFQPKNFKKSETVEEMRALKLDILVVAAYGLLLPQRVLDIPRYGCINVHASLLPRWRGASPIQQSVLAGDQTTGISIMQMTAGMDEGPILYQVSYSIGQNDTSQTVHDALATLGCQALCEVLSHFADYQAKAVSQPIHNVTYAPKIQKHNAKIDWSQPAVAIERAIRAFQPWPVIYSTLGDTVVRIFKAIVLPETAKSLPGTILDTESGIIYVATQQGILGITRAQLPGKSVMSSQALLNGHGHLFIKGSQFK